MKRADVTHGLGSVCSGASLPVNSEITVKPSGTISNEGASSRKHDGLGQDPSYMRRNFQIVHHLTTGAEEVDPLENPKKWRGWKMPNRDFTLIVLDSRLWRSSQDVDMWDDAGWDAFKSLYDRTDPTRSLLGEEQFGWLQEWLSTGSSPTAIQFAVLVAMPMEP